MTSRAEAFWLYSLRIYARDDVATACLWLQDRRGLDVNMLLFCCWLGEHGVTLDAECLHHARRAVAPWSAEVVQPLRRARRWIKQRIDAGQGESHDAHAALRDRIKTLELEAERLEQALLESFAPPLAGDAHRKEVVLRTMLDNIARYLHSADVLLDAQVLERLAMLLAGAAGAPLAESRAAWRRLGETEGDNG